MEFNEEELTKILSGEGESAEKVKTILNLYNDNVNGLKMNRDDIKKEKEDLKAKYAELEALNAKGAEDLKTLKAQLEANSPEEIRKAYETQRLDAEKAYKGAIEERDTKLKLYESQLAEVRQSEHHLKCIQEFNKAVAKYDIEPSGQNFLMETILGAKGEKFVERDLGNGNQLIDNSGKSIAGEVDDFCASPLGKKFLRNGNSGGGATGSGSTGTGGIDANPFLKGHENLTKQAELYRTNPALYERLKNEAGA